MMESAENVPLGGLPPSSRVVLRRSQLELALVEVRFAPDRDVISSEDALSFAASLRGRDVNLPQIQPAQQQQITVNVTPTGASPEVDVVSRGWQLTGADGHLVMTFMPDALAVQTSRYIHWSETLAPLLAAASVAAKDVINPGLVQRLGLRYVNRFVDLEAQSPLDWSGRLDGFVLGPVLHPELGPRMIATQQQMEFSLGESQGALVRHGLFKDGAARGAFSYLVDIDVFDTQTTAFDAMELVERATTLNRTAMSLFRQIVTESYINEMDAQAEDTSKVEGHAEEATE